MDISDLVSASDVNDSGIEAICGKSIVAQWKKLFLEQFVESLPSFETCSSSLKSFSGKDVDVKEVVSCLNVTSVKFIEQNTFKTFLASPSSPEIGIDQLQL